MAKQTHLQAILSAVDRLSPVLAKIGVSTTRTRAVLMTLDGLNFKGLRGTLRLAHKSVADVGSAASGVGEKLLPLVGLGALSLGGIAAGFVSAGKSALDYAGALQDASDNTGIAMGALQQLQTVFMQGGVAGEDFTAAVTKLNKGLADAGAGKDKGLASLMTKLRIPLRNVKGELRSVEEVLPELADAFEKNENPAVRTRIAMELFGKAGAKMIAVLGKGGKSMTEARGEALRLGAVLSDLAIQGPMVDGKRAGGLDDLGDALGVLGQQARVQIAEAFGAAAPALNGAVKSLQEWFASNKELLQQKVGGVIRDLAESFTRWVNDGGIQKLGDQLKSMTEGLGNVVDKMGGLGNVAKLVGVLLLAGPVASLASLAGAIVRLGLVFLANPILLVIAGIAAGAVLLYQNWDQVAPYFERLWDRVGSIASTVWDGLKLLFSWSPLGMIVSNWQEISGWFSGFWEGLKGVATVAWNVVRFLFSWSPLGIIVNNWGAVMTWLGTFWVSLNAVAVSGVALVQGLLEQWKPLDRIRSAWEPVLSFLGEVWERIDRIVGPGLRMLGNAAGAVGSFFNEKFGAQANNAEFGPRFGGPSVPVPALVGPQVLPRGMGMVPSLPRMDALPRGLGLVPPLPFPRIDRADDDMRARRDSPTGAGFGSPFAAPRPEPTPLVRAGAMQTQSTLKVDFTGVQKGVRITPAPGMAPGITTNVRYDNSPDVGIRGMGGIG